jgi:hypothetical protein
LFKPFLFNASYILKKEKRRSKTERLFKKKPKLTLIIQESLHKDSEIKTKLVIFYCIENHKIKLKFKKDNFLAHFEKSIAGQFSSIFEYF